MTSEKLYRNTLSRSSAASQSKFQAANMHYNKKKNRNANVLALDDTRVKLSVVTGIKDSDYINANFIDGYMMRRAFIATQATWYDPWLLEHDLGTEVFDCCDAF